MTGKKTYTCIHLNVCSQKVRRKMDKICLPTKLIILPCIKVIEEQRTFKKERLNISMSVHKKSEKKTNRRHSHFKSDCPTQMRSI